MREAEKLKQSPAALVFVDVVNHFEFPEGELLLRQASPVAPLLATLKARAREAGMAVIYVNDNFGQWRSDAKELLRYCLRPEAPGREFVEAIQPEPEDFVVLKPMHSAFYQTPMDVLLRALGATSLIVCGLATNSCVLCTAHDAKMRGFGLFIPADCSASRTLQEHEQAIEHIRTMTAANVTASTELRMEEVLEAGRSEGAASVFART
jgi:nicotinamidase-related amidase